MWEKNNHKPQMTGNGKHTTYKKCDLGDGLLVFYPNYIDYLMHCRVSQLWCSSHCYSWFPLQFSWPFPCLPSEQHRGFADQRLQAILVLSLMRLSMYVCMYECMYVCIYVSMYVCMYVCMFVCMYVGMHVCLSVCLSVFLSVCLSVRMYVCMYVSLYVFQYVCT
jgi:hypothetical protein